MDMNTVMYPEISREAPMMMHGKSGGMKMKDGYERLKMDQSTYVMASTDITTLNWRTAC
jgi:hypothetical protein